MNKTLQDYIATAHKAEFALNDAFRAAFKPGQSVEWYHHSHLQTGIVHTIHADGIISYIKAKNDRTNNLVTVYIYQLADAEKQRQIEVCDAE